MNGSIPSSGTSESNNIGFRSIHLPPLHQVSLIVPFHAVLTIKCSSGIAEINGRELPDKLPVDLLPGTRVAVFSYQGCSLLVSDPRPLPSHQVVSFSADSTDASQVTMSDPIPNPGAAACANLHVALESARHAAFSHSGDLLGPRVMIAGAPDTGKSTLARILSNYALKSDSHPLFVDLNPENPIISLPGTLSIMPVTHPLDASLGLCASHATIQATGLGSLPFILWHGSDQPVRSYGTTYWQLYTKLCQQLHMALSDKIKQDTDDQCSGVILDCPGGLSHDQLFTLAAQFQVNYLVYLTKDGSDVPPPTSPLSTDLQVLPLPALLGTRPKTRQVRKYLHLHAIREYFYGPMGAVPGTVARSPLTPHNITVPTAVIDVVQISETQSPSEEHEVEVKQTSSSSVPATINSITAVSSVPPSLSEGPGTIFHEPLFENESNNNIPASSLCVTKVTDSTRLMHSVLAVLNSDTSWTDLSAVAVDDVVSANVLGFVYVSDYNDVRDKLNLLVPFPGRLPTTRLAAGSVKWMELA